jgi:hypothetical protein
MSQPFKGSKFLKDHDAAAQRRIVELFPAERREAAIRRAIPGRPVNASSVEDALNQAGANFTVAKRPMMAVLDADHAVEVPGKVALCRMDSGQPLGIATPAYGVVQLADVFAPAQVLVERGEMELTSLQVVNGGSKVRLGGLLGVSVIERLGGSEAPDALAHFASFEADFSGAARNQARLFTLRLVCFNGATTKDSSGLVSIRHSLNAENRTREAYATLLNLSQAALREAGDFQRMASVPMGRNEYLRFAQRLLAEVRGEADTADKVTRREREIVELCELFVNGAGNTGSTLWDGYNSVTDWLDHQHERSGKAKQLDRVFESNTYGTGDRVKAKARALLARY